jgi:hypothetical protein
MIASPPMLSPILTLPIGVTPLLLYNLKRS